MLITIVTVCFNSERTIARTIESVLGQTYGEVEYIVIDGCSSDHTLDIIRSYEARIREKGYSFTLISEPDNGMYDAMNKGIGMASGDLLGLLNSDDWYEPEALETVAGTFAGHPDADIVMGAIRIYNGDHTFIKKARDRRYKTSRDFNHPAMFVTSECYRQVGPYGTGNVHDDYGWYLRAMKRGCRTVTTDSVLTNYPTGGAGSYKSLKNTIERIGTKYKVYKENGYSKFYFLECVVQELGKFLLLKN